MRTLPVLFADRNDHRQTEETLFVGSLGTHFVFSAELASSAVDGCGDETAVLTIRSNDVELKSTSELATRIPFDGIEAFLELLQRVVARARSNGTIPSVTRAEGSEAL